MFYAKPVIAIINGGARSGKEALALSLKRSERAKLVDEHTDGAFLGGQFFELGPRAALYLVVQNVEIMGTHLEGVGVSADVQVKDANSNRGNRDSQLDKALSMMQELFQSAPSKP
jgi:carboxyl-terminal processing protease